MPPSPLTRFKRFHLSRYMEVKFLVKIVFSSSSHIFFSFVVFCHISSSVGQNSVNNQQLSSTNVCCRKPSDQQFDGKLFKIISALGKICCFLVSFALAIVCLGPYMRTSATAR